MDVRSRHWVARWSAARAECMRRDLTRLWFWFRDHWGVVWALRNQERFNRTAELAGWPVRLTWYGLEPVAPTRARRRAGRSAEAETTFRGLIRRFAQAWRLDQVVRVGSPRTSCDHGVGGPR